MKIEIDGKEFTKADLQNWKRKRLPKVARNLGKNLKPSDDVDMLCNELLEIKKSMTYEEIVSSIRCKLLVGEIGMKLVSVFSFGKRKNR